MEKAKPVACLMYSGCPSHLYVLAAFGQPFSNDNDAVFPGGFSELGRKRAEPKEVLVQVLGNENVERAPVAPTELSLYRTCLVLVLEGQQRIHDSKRVLQTKAYICLLVRFVERLDLAIKGLVLMSLRFR